MAVHLMTPVELAIVIDELGIGYEGLAAELGISNSGMRKYLRGERKIPSPVAILVRMRVRGRTRTLNEVMKAHS